MKTKQKLVLAALLTSLTIGAQAAVVNVITPTGVSIVDSTSNYASPGGTGSLIDGSGLSATIGETIDTATVSTITVSGDIDTIGWRRNGSATPAVDLTFNLAGITSLSGIIIGNYVESSAYTYRGISTFGLEISTDGGFSYTFAQTVNPAQASSGGNLQFIDLGVTYTGVTNIKFNDATYFSSDGAQIMGLTEVRFTSPIPEPSAALLGGLSML